MHFSTRVDGISRKEGEKFKFRKIVITCFSLFQRVCSWGAPRLRKSGFWANCDSITFQARAFAPVVLLSVFLFSIVSTTGVIHEIRNSVSSTLKFISRARGLRWWLLFILCENIIGFIQKVQGYILDSINANKNTTPIES